jgi:hypothetical protein
MQLMYAAPFLITAGLVFILLSSFRRLRRWAIALPTAIIAFGPGSLILALLAGLTWTRLLRQTDFTNWIAGSLYVLGGIAAALIAGLLVKVVTPFLGKPLRRLAIAGAAFCSYFVTLSALQLVVIWKWNLASAVFAWWITAFIVCVSLIPSWLLSQKLADFFPNPSIWSGYRNERISAIRR